MSGDTYYINREGQQPEPASVLEITAKIKAGELPPYTLLWREDWKEWKKCGTLPEFCSLYPASGMPLPPSPQGLTTEKESRAAARDGENISVEANENAVADEITDDSDVRRRSLKRNILTGKKVWMVLAALLLLVCSGVGYWAYARYLSPEADYHKAENFEKRKDLKSAEEWYRKAAERGYAPAQYVLGNYYMDGVWVDEDKETAFSWYSKAAKQHHPFAQLMLAECYQTGKGVEANDELAEKWYNVAVSESRKLAKKGDAEAQYILALCYENGYGVKIDQKKAFQWFIKSAEQEYVPAQSALGECYKHGIGVTRSSQKAEYWLMEAAKRGSVGALESLKELTGKL